MTLMSAFWVNAGLSPGVMGTTVNNEKFIQSNSSSIILYSSSN
jgi:hypothetical protein